MRLTRFALALSTLVVVSDLGGQVTLDSAVRTLTPGETVRIRVSGGDRIESHLVSVHTQPLGLRLSGTSAAVDAGDIDSLWVKGNATRVGTNTGALVGGGLSFAFWAAVCTGVNEGSGCDAWGTVAALGVVGGIVGAFVGAGIGSMVPTWQLRYPRR